MAGIVVRCALILLLLVIVAASLTGGGKTKARAEVVQEPNTDLDASKAAWLEETLELWQNRAATAKRCSTFASDQQLKTMCAEIARQDRSGLAALGQHADNLGVHWQKERKTPPLRNQPQLPTVQAMDIAYALDVIRHTGEVGRIISGRREWDDQTIERIIRPLWKRVSHEQPAIMLLYDAIRLRPGRSGFFSEPIAPYTEPDLPAPTPARRGSRDILPSERFQ